MPLCQCSLGFTGHLCEIQVNECESNPCQNNGQCHDLVGGYECNCLNTGFHGLNCEIDIDECVMSADYCGDDGQCVNLPGSFKCICEQEFCGAYCNVTDPCKRNSDQPICLNGGICIETCKNTADYYCNCTEGYTGKNCTNLVKLTKIYNINI